MKIKVLCDRCFKDVTKDKVLYKFGSVVYCKKYHEEIEKELFDELLKDYLAPKDEERENELAYEIANYKSEELISRLENIEYTFNGKANNIALVIGEIKKVIYYRHIDKLRWIDISKKIGYSVSQCHIFYSIVQKL